MHVRSPRLKAPSNQEGADGTLTTRTPSVLRGCSTETADGVVLVRWSFPPTDRTRPGATTAHAADGGGDA